MSLEELKRLQVAYEEGREEIPDSEFDSKVEEYEKKTGTKFSEIGAPVRHNRIRLPQAMPSLDKIKGKLADLKLKGWKRSHPSKFYDISYKVDGMSALYWDGKLYSRGDGEVGSDISHILNLLRFSSNRVRGELILLKSDFNEMEGYKKARNTVVGMVGRYEKIDLPLKFLAYSLYGEERNHFDVLREMGYETPWIERVEKLDLEYLEKKLREANPPYDIDGLVIRAEDGNQIAFKLDKSLRTKVIDIKWKLSKGNIWKPVVVFEPLYFDAQVTKASGKNAAFLVKNKLGVGSEIEISKAGDVIPDITGIYSEGEMIWPPNCRWGESQVDLISLDENSEDLKIARMLHFMKTLDIKEMGEARVKMLVKSGFSLEDILKAEVKDISGLERMGEKIGTKMIESIRMGISHVELGDLMAASSIFPGGLGKKRLNAIVEKIPDIMSRSVSVDEVKMEGCDTLADIFVEKLDDFKEWLKDLPISIAETKKRVGEIIVFSGFRDPELKKKLEMEGKKVEDNVTKKTQLVIVLDLNSDSNSVKKAKKYGIPIVEKK